MTYEFRQLGERGDFSLPSSIQTIYAGTNLDREFTRDDTSFITLTTKGRGLVSHEFEERDINGRQTLYLEDIKVRRREVVVKCQIKAKNNEGFRRIMEEINKMLIRRTVSELEFTDDEDWYFNAILSEVSDVEENTNKAVVELTFYCQNPYKYKKEKTILVSSADILSIDTHFPIVPEEIIITFNGQPDDIQIHNTHTEQKIVFKVEGGQVGKTNKLYINQKETFIGYTNNQNAFLGVNLLESDFKQFSISDGEQVVVQPTPQSVEITYRGRKL